MNIIGAFVQALRTIVGLTPVAPRKGVEPVAGRIRLADSKGRITTDGRIIGRRLGLIDSMTDAADETVILAGMIARAVLGGLLNMPSTGRPAAKGRLYTDGVSVWSPEWHQARIDSAPESTNAFAVAVKAALAEAEATPKLAALDADEVLAKLLAPEEVKQ